MSEEELKRKAWQLLKSDELHKITSGESRQIFEMTKIKWSCKCRSKLKDAIIYLLTKNDRELRPKYKIDQLFGFVENQKCYDYINMTDADIERFLTNHPSDWSDFIKKRNE